MYLNIYTQIMLAEQEGHSEKHTASTDTLPECTHVRSCIFSTVRDDDLLLGLALFASLSLGGGGMGGKRYKIQQLITRKEHFHPKTEQPWSVQPLNYQTDAHVSGE